MAAPGKISYAHWLFSLVKVICHALGVNIGDFDDLGFQAATARRKLCRQRTMA